MSKKSITFDPTDLQIDSYKKINLSDMDLEEFSNPQAVKMMIYQHVINLHELKATKSKLDNKEIELEAAKKEREDLRVNLAGLEQTVGIDLASIAVSFLGGFSINMLTENWQDGLGWIIFILCIAIILILKLPLISKRWNSNKESETA